MSKFLNISAVLLLLLAITFTRCQKQDLQQNQVDEQTVLYPTLNKILNFQQIVENPTSKNNDLMSIDSAVWYIEALLNYQYGIITDSSEVYYETKTDSAFFNINTTAGKIEIMDVVSAFYEIETVVVDGLKDIKHQNKRIDIIDIEYKNEQFVAYFQYNYGEQIFGGKYLYNITDNWQWGHWLGNCAGQYSGEKDLRTEIVKWIKYNRGVLYNVTWTNVGTMGQFASHGGTYPFTGMIDLAPYYIDMFWLYQEGQWDGLPIEHCIYQIMGTHYAEETLEALGVIEDEFLPTGYKVICIDRMEALGFLLPTMTDHFFIGHSIDVRYGKPIITIPTQ